MRYRSPSESVLSRALRGRISVAEVVEDALAREGRGHGVAPPTRLGSGDSSFMRRGNGNSRSYFTRRLIWRPRLRKGEQGGKEAPPSPVGVEANAAPPERGGKAALVAAPDHGRGGASVRASASSVLCTHSSPSWPPRGGAAAAVDVVATACPPRRRRI